MQFLATGLAAALALIAPTAKAQSDMRSEQVRFAAGASGTTIDDTITGYENVLYTLGAKAGQRMTVRLEPSNLSTYFNVYAPGRGPGDEALINSQFTGPMVPDINSFDALLRTSGDYTVSIYMMRNAARRNEASNYAITVSIVGELDDVVQSDFSDGLQGGPDFNQVATRSGGALNLRSDPSSGSMLVAQLANGQDVRNLGCRMAEGRRWCRVATLADPGQEGWVAGDFLAEDSGSPSSEPTSEERACLQAVIAETNNPAIVLLGSRFSEAGTEVTVGVGAQRAPWQCIAYSDGSTTRPMSMTDEGNL